MMHIMQHMRLIGFLAIFISAFTWGLDLAHLVPPCPFCQAQRTMIGFLGILMIIPDYRYATQFLTVVFGLFGVHVSCAQIFNHVASYAFTNMFIILATGALCLLVAQMLMLLARAYQRYV
jgi:hypothetical protein